MLRHVGVLTCLIRLSIVVRIVYNNDVRFHLFWVSDQFRILLSVGAERLDSEEVPDR